MTARELAALLQRVPPDMEVMLEGCDCFTTPTGIAVVEADHDGHKLSCAADGHPHVLVTS